MPNTFSSSHNLANLFKLDLFMPKISTRCCNWAIHLCLFGMVACELPRNLSGVIAWYFGCTFHLHVLLCVGVASFFRRKRKWSRFITSFEFDHRQGTSVCYSIAKRHHCFAQRRLGWAPTWTWTTTSELGRIYFYKLNFFQDHTMECKLSRVVCFTSFYWYIYYIIFISNSNGCNIWVADTKFESRYVQY